MNRLQHLLETDPQAVVCDLHPEYASARYARSLDLPRVEVQHHHAHVISCMADGMDVTPMITRKIGLEEVTENLVKLQTDRDDVKITVIPS